MTHHGEINWNELQSRDPDAAIRFYGETAGWTFQAESMPSGGTYWLALAAGKPVAGILALDGDAHTDRWMTYIHVDDLDQALQRAKRLGATVLREPWEIPGVGRVSMLREPGGAEVGWVTPPRQPGDQS